jgi:hypothetical protein
MTLKACSVLGVGKMFSLYHQKNIKKNKYKIISIFDPRKKLLTNVKKKLKIKSTYSNIIDFIKFTNCKYFFFFLPRDVSFFFLRKLLDKKNIFIFIEKPPVLYKKNFEIILKKAKKNNVKIYIGYMFRYSEILKKFSKILNNISNEKITSINAEMSLNNILKTKYKNLYKERISDIYNEKKPYFIKNKEIDYKVFLNRYSHILNLIIFLFPNVKLFKFSQEDIFNYKIILKNKKNLVFLDLNNKKNYFLSFKIFFKNNTELIMNLVYKKNFFNIILKLKKNNKIKIYHNVKEDLYFNEIKLFNKLKNSFYQKQIDDFKKTILISEMIMR